MKWEDVKKEENGIEIDATSGGSINCVTFEINGQKYRVRQGNYSSIYLEKPFIKKVMAKVLEYKDAITGEDRILEYVDEYQYNKIKQELDSFQIAYKEAEKEIEVNE